MLVLDTVISTAHCGQSVRPYDRITESTLSLWVGTKIFLDFFPAWESCFLSVIKDRICDWKEEQDNTSNACSFIINMLNVLT